MTVLLLACQKCSQRSPDLAWKHRPFRTGRTQIEVFYAVSGTAPDFYKSDSHCNWVMDARHVDGFVCNEFDKQWRDKPVGTNFLDHDRGIMFSQRPAATLQSKLAALQPTPSIIPQQVTIPNNERASWPLGLRIEMDTEEREYRKKLQDEATRHVNANADIEREHRKTVREITTNWGRRV